MSGFFSLASNRTHKIRGVAWFIYFFSGSSVCSSVCNYRTHRYQQKTQCTMRMYRELGGTVVLAPSIYWGGAVHTSDVFFLVCALLKTHPWDLILVSLSQSTRRNGSESWEREISHWRIGRVCASTSHKTVLCSEWRYTNFRGKTIMTEQDFHLKLISPIISMVLLLFLKPIVKSPRYDATNAWTQNHTVKYAKIRAIFLTFTAT